MCSMDQGNNYIKPRALKWIINQIRTKVDQATDQGSTRQQNPDRNFVSNHASEYHDNEHLDKTNDSLYLVEPQNIRFVFDRT